MSQNGVSHAPKEKNCGGQDQGQGAAKQNAEAGAAAPDGRNAPQVNASRMMKASCEVLLERLRNVVQASSVAGVIYGTYINPAAKAAAKRSCFQMLETMGTEVPGDLRSLLAAA